MEVQPKFLLRSPPEVVWFAVPGSGIHCEDVLHGSFSTIEAPRGPTESRHASAMDELPGGEINGTPGMQEMAGWKIPELNGGFNRNITYRNGPFSSHV